MAEQDFAAIGRIVAERKEIKEKIDSIKNELASHSEPLRQLGSALVRNQERIVFTGQSTTTPSHPQSAPIYKISDNLIPHLKESVNTLREELEKLEAVERRAHQYGV